MNKLQEKNYFSEKDKVDHILKTDPEYFQNIVDGIKKFEIRKNDRNFQVGDYILLFEYDRQNDVFSNRYLLIQISYLLTNVPEFGLYDGYCVFGFEIIVPEVYYTSNLHDEPIHHWFELSYAQYLTIPRSVLQSMDFEWQKRFVRCLEELDTLIDWRPSEGSYWVYLKDAKGRYVTDPLSDYQRGRRTIETKKPATCIQK